MPVAERTDSPYHDLFTIPGPTVNSNGCMVMLCARCSQAPHLFAVYNLPLQQTGLMSVPKSSGVSNSKEPAAEGGGERGQKCSQPGCEEYSPAWTTWEDGECGCINGDDEKEKAEKARTNGWVEDIE